ncbi:MAG: phosphoenolpyruvate--protein phosphotransferase [Beijerinckiaceae bacterium]
MAERRLTGRPASPGFAAGPLITLIEGAAKRTASGDPALEAAALTAALATAAAELAELAERSEGNAADILAFQIALVEDDALAEPAFAAIAEGAAADAAWSAALDAEIASYVAAEDEHFRARAADFRDLRDRVLAALAGAQADEPLPAGAIVAAHDLAPSRFLAIDWSGGGGILLADGSPTSHLAMLARSRGVAMIVGLGCDPTTLAGEVLVDAEAGEAILDPEPQTRQLFELHRKVAAQRHAEASELLDKPAVTRDGTRIGIYLNLADPAELDRLDPYICDGVGLVRTEFLFHGQSRLPDEDTQYATYRRIVEWAGARPVTIRTLDAGGDKPIPGFTIAGESNPFLGLRGIRLSLTRPDVFRVQLRALARAAAHGTVKIMLPMVTTQAELVAARAMLEEEVAALQAARVPMRRPPLGMMVEVPAAAIAIDTFDADFFSIGSNDLTQYVTAAGRDIGAVADLADVLNPAVLRLIAHVTRHGFEAGREVSLCGDAGGDPAVLPHLLAAGLRSLSMAPATVARAKAAIAAIDLNVPRSSAAA